MNRLYILLAVVLLNTGCTKLDRISFVGKAPALKSATFLVNDVSGATIGGVNIRNGAFKLDTILENIGYGIIEISKDGDKNKNQFEVYLEPGKYIVDIDAANLDKYPKITTESKLQKELSTYYTLQDEMTSDASKLVKELSEKVSRANPAYMSFNSFIVLLDRYRIAQNSLSQIQLKAFKAYIEQYPNSTISARLMRMLSYEQDPVVYNKIYEKLSPAAKETAEGKEISSKLQHLLKLIPGADAPDIAGTTPDGKTFDKTKLDRELYVIDFWRAGSPGSRSNHQDMIKHLLHDSNASRFGVISVSLDSKRNWWETAIKDDKMTWPQYSDLKGDESANIENWFITSIPTYYLVDKNWRIIERDVNFSRLGFEISQYLEHHGKSNLKHIAL